MYQANHYPLFYFGFINSKIKNIFTCYGFEDLLFDMPFYYNLAF